MPCFKWTAIDYAGQMYHGTCYERSVERLADRLYVSELGLVSARSLTFFSRPRRYEFIAAYRQCASLLEAGLRLQEALHVVSATLKHPYARHIFCDAAKAVGEGSSLSEILGAYSVCCDRSSAAILGAGEQSGKLHEALYAIASNLERREKFFERLRHALAMPLFTFAFFIVVLAVVLVVVVPHFARTLESMRATIPRATGLLIALSSWLISWWWAMGILFFVLAVGLAVALRYRPYLVNRALLRLPVVGALLRDRARIMVVHTLALLLRSGVRLVPGLRAAYAVVPTVLANDYELVIKEIESGVPFSVALSNKPFITTPDLEALVMVGERTGSLALVLGQAALVLEERFNQRLRFITTYIQPCLIVILGGLIALMIALVYLPLVSLQFSFV